MTVCDQRCQVTKHNTPQGKALFWKTLQEEFAERGIPVEDCFPLLQKLNDWAREENAKRYRKARSPMPDRRD